MLTSFITVVSLLSADRKECSSWFQLTGPATVNAIWPNLVLAPSSRYSKSIGSSTVQTMTAWMGADFVTALLTYAGSCTSAAHAPLYWIQ